VKQGLIPKEQQHWAAAGSSSTGQIGGSISSMSFKRMATLRQGTAAQLAGDAGPALKRQLR